jgi:hypothetical protein
MADHQQHQRHEPQVASPGQPALALVQLTSEPAFLDIAAEQLQTGMRRELLVRELDPLRLLLIRAAKPRFPILTGGGLSSVEFFEPRNPKNITT